MLETMTPSTRKMVGVISLVMGILSALGMAGVSGLAILVWAIGESWGGTSPTLGSAALLLIGSFVLGWIAAAGLIAGGAGFLSGRDRSLARWKVGALATGVVAGVLSLLIPSVLTIAVG